jgi:phosphoglycerate dehydrogenase-like enzyme
MPFDAAQALAARSVSLEQLLAAADVVTLHVPLLDETQGMIGNRELALIKPGAVLIQAARGGIVDEAALAAHLAAGRLGGAAVDVYATEPPGPDNPLLQLGGEGARRLLLTPHIAGVTRQSSQLLFRASWQHYAVRFHIRPCRTCGTRRSLEANTRIRRGYRRSARRIRALR